MAADAAGGAGSAAEAVVGVISDTHGTLDPRVYRQFRGVDRILHAGDIGPADVLLQLETIAPVTAVLGNVDDVVPGFLLQPTARMSIAGVTVVMTHLLRTREIARFLPEAGVVVSGHTHVPSVQLNDGVLFVNPGSASRSRLPGGQRTVAILEIRDGLASARIVEL